MKFKNHVVAVLVAMLLFSTTGQFSSSIPDVAAEEMESAPSSTKNLSTNGERSKLPQIALSENNVYIVWQDKTPGNYDIFFTKSTDNGASFGDVINLSNTPAESFNPDIAASDNNVYVVWQDTELGNWDIFFTKSTDNGASFSDVINVSDVTRRSKLPQIAVFNSNVYIVWQDKTPGNYDIFFTKSTDNGASFGDVINLSNTPAESWNPQIAILGNNVYVVWQDKTIGNWDIFFAKSTDNGASFGDVINRSSNTLESLNPDIAASDSNVYVVWQDGTPRNSGIFFTKSTDNGASFGDVINLSNTPAESWNPQIAISGNDLYVVWQDSTPRNSGIFFTKSTDNGASFSSDIVNSGSNIVESWNPEIAILGNNVYVVWQDKTLGNYDIFFTQNSNSGAGFSDAVKSVFTLIKEQKASSAFMTKQKMLTSVTVKNNSSEPIFGLSISLDSGNLRFVKAKGWDRDRVDRSTVIVSTNNKPIVAEGSFLISLIIDEADSPLEFTAISKDKMEIGRGAKVMFDFNFAAAGDWDCRSETEDTVNNIVRRDVELVLGLGDYAYPPEENEDCWLQIVDPLDGKIKAAIGNHEGESSSRLRDVMNYFNLTKQYYSFDYQNVHFIVMSTEISFAKDSEQYRFVIDDLEDAAVNPSIDWTIVYYHKIAYSSPSTIDVIGTLRDIYHPIFDRYGVDLVIQAHLHNYQRSYPLAYNEKNRSDPIITDYNKDHYNDPQGIIFATVGTGGTSLHDLAGKVSYMVTQHLGHGFLNVDVKNNGTMLVATFYANDGTVKDQFNITKFPKHITIKLLDNAVG